MCIYSDTRDIDIYIDSDRSTIVLLTRETQIFFHFYILEMHTVTHNNIHLTCNKMIRDRKNVKHTHRQEIEIRNIREYVTILRNNRNTRIEMKHTHTCSSSSI